MSSVASGYRGKSARPSGHVLEDNRPVDSGQAAAGPQALQLQRMIGNRATQRRLAPRRTRRDGAENGVHPPSDAAIHQTAEAGVRGHGHRLPHLAAIQSSFGRHAIDHIQAYSGARTSAASQAIGARAYATGDKVAFAEHPSLHMAAHEAAHVIQQRAGVQLGGGVGRAGDVYERNADAVADAVVQGRSAEGLLDAVASPGPRRRSLASGVQAVQAYLGFEFQVARQTHELQNHQTGFYDRSENADSVALIETSDDVVHEDDEAGYHLDCDCGDVEFVTNKFEETAEGMVQFTAAITAMNAFINNHAKQGPLRCNKKEDYYVTIGSQALDASPQISAGLNFASLWNTMKGLEGPPDQEEENPKAKWGKIYDPYRNMTKEVVDALNDLELSEAAKGVAALLATYVRGPNVSGIRQKYGKYYTPFLLRQGLNQALSHLSADEAQDVLDLIAGEKNNDDFTFQKLLGNDDPERALFPTGIGDKQMDNIKVSSLIEGFRRAAENAKKYAGTKNVVEEDSDIQEIMNLYTGGRTDNQRYQRDIGMGSGLANQANKTRHGGVFEFRMLGPTKIGSRDWGQWGKSFQTKLSGWQRGYSAEDADENLVRIKGPPALCASGDLDAYARAAGADESLTPGAFAQDQTQNKYADYPQEWKILYIQAFEAPFNQEV